MQPGTWVRLTHPKIRHKISLARRTQAQTQSTLAQALLKRVYFRGQIVNCLGVVHKQTPQACPCEHVVLATAIDGSTERLIICNARILRGSKDKELRLHFKNGHRSSVCVCVCVCTISPGQHTRLQPLGQDAIAPRMPCA